MLKNKLALSVYLLFFVSFVYSQEGYRVDKDYRIKKYQEEMISFLINENQFGTEIKKKTKLIKDYSNLMSIQKCLEVFLVEPKENQILLVLFYSFGSGANKYWGILEKDNKYFFYYDEKDKFQIEAYLKKYDIKTQKIILDYVKIYTDWDGPNLHNPQIIEEHKID
ncbi:hypothetical protein SAMN05444143_1392 [Flavobacterium succinicans]|uniref:Uncharacterized protein n=1 Tax=Flavobacterium succinicans TaxID=29536 RepID=A0A1I5AFD6_9FLAO|nr:hypothetical protein [Flavobacterium succinicans]SFN61147.1 hypothetical protein SAMN05444143_1392 [Flavobacterium succinicans]